MFIHPPTQDELNKLFFICPKTHPKKFAFFRGKKTKTLEACGFELVFFDEDSAAYCKNVPLPVWFDGEVDNSYMMSIEFIGHSTTSDNPYIADDYISLDISFSWGGLGIEDVVSNMEIKNNIQDIKDTVRSEINAHEFHPDSQRPMRIHKELIFLEIEKSLDLFQRLTTED